MHKGGCTLITYKHKVQYYETDRMGITHHSNYIRWMEEARTDFLDRIGFNYADMESRGLSSPVIGVQCDYKASTTFDDIIEIESYVLSCTSAKFIVGYKMTKNGNLVFTGQSTHCFIDTNGKIVRLHKELPELYNILCENKKANHL